MVDLKKAVESLHSAIYIKDFTTGEHSKRVSKLCHLIAKKLEYKSRILPIAGLLHDVGKIGISDEILNKFGRLSETEYHIIKRHSFLGSKVLEKIGNEELSKAVYRHHEKLDGSGYPLGVKADRIPFDSQIITVCDIFDAITSCRPYLERRDIIDVIEILTKEEKHKINQDIVESLVSIDLSDLILVIEPHCKKECNVDKLIGHNLNSLYHPKVREDFNHFYLGGYLVDNFNKDMEDYFKT